jgi:hypothetical protein
MVRQVAAEHPATVQLDDFGAQLCPGGVYQTTLNGVQIRDGDGVHIVPTAAAGEWLDARVLPDVVNAGRLQMDGQTLVPTTSSTAPSSSLAASARGSAP